MKPTSLTPHLLAGLLTLAATSGLRAQYAPPPPLQPFPGFINQELRAKDPYWSNWDFGGSLRLRYEGKENAGFTLAGAAADFRKNGADNHNIYLMERLRVRAGYTDKWWGVFAEGRQSSTTGDERHPNAESDGPMDLHQAYVTLGNHKEFPLSLKVGRQELSYGDERLIGAFAWNNIGRVFDAAKVRWQNSWFGADFFTSRVIIPDDNNINVPNDYDWFSGVYATSKRLPKNTTELYFLSRNTAAGSPAALGVGLPAALNGPAPRDIYTVGLRFKSNPGDFGNWDYTAEFMGQFGHFNDSRLAASQSHEHQAYAIAVNGGYTFADAWATPRLALEYAHGSGDSNPNDGKHETFENLFPTNHKFYGYMDFFSLQNLHDVRFISTLKPHPRLSLAVEYHLFWLDSDLDNLYSVAGAPRGGLGNPVGGYGSGYGNSSANSKFVGSELDIVAGCTLTKFSSLEAGYGHFFRGDYIKNTFSSTTTQSTDADWFYLQLNVNF